MSPGNVQNYEILIWNGNTKMIIWATFFKLKFNKWQQLVLENCFYWLCQKPKKEFKITFVDESKILGSDEKKIAEMFNNLLLML